MRALVCKQYGPAKNSTIEVLPDPETGPGQALVRIGTAGINFRHWQRVRPALARILKTHFLCTFGHHGIRGLNENINGLAISKAF